VARDGRRTVFGEAKSASEISEAYVPEQLETLARKCRLLVICIPEKAAGEAIDTLFYNAQMSQWPKMRLLRYPGTMWEEPPKAAGRKAAMARRPPGP
jgi:hypothetical protein